MDEMTRLLESARLGEESSDDKAGGEPTAHAAPPPYAALSSHSVAPEAAAEGSGNHDADFHPQKAKMAMIAAHASKQWSRQTWRNFCSLVGAEEE